MIQILAAIIAGFGAFLLLRSLWIRSGLTPRQTAWTALALTVVLVLIGLAATGRLNWVVAAAAATLPFLRRLPSLLKVLPILNWLFPRWQQRYRSRPAAGGPNESTTETAMLRMTLNHTTGHMDGEIKSGPYQGRLLSELTANQLVALMASTADFDSQRLLESYLDRNHPNWRAHQQDSAGATGGSSGAMSRSEALEILGLADGASKEEIVGAHRRLIQRLHPDRGGSTFLAAQINGAKKLLLED